MIPRNLTMLTDFYEFTMSNGYLKNGLADTVAYFDMFFRKIPDNGGYAVMAGLEQLCDYLNGLSFTHDDIDYLRSKGCFCEEFLNYLKNFRFSCDVWAIPEGTPVFPGEPLVTVRGPVIQAQFIETMVLLNINHQSLIATKASRMVRAAQGRAIMEFGSRRAQGADGAILGARAAYIAGCAGTACAITDRAFGVPAVGTMAHSWVQLFDSEFEAFRAYAKVYPDNCVLLIDTYNVLHSGVKNAIRCAKEVLEPAGHRLKGVRIDSGDIAYLTKKTREALDAAGLSDCKITVSNSLDEFLIRDLLLQGARIDSFGIGERLITSKSEPVFGGVYKLAAIEDKDGNIIPKIKISENVEKITTPHFKQIYRLTSHEDGKYIADVLTLRDETIDTKKPYTIFDPTHTWKKRTLESFSAEPLLVQIFKDGKQVYKCPPINEVRAYCAEKLSNLWSEVARFENPHPYYVDLSQKLWDIKRSLLEKY
ncbi:MAG: nicotinate phosphoribosyltransferase [Clostridia bacterium]|nr:nicotinate phosphoribosyltransferase [Clostridia bacterium]